MHVKEKIERYFLSVINNERHSKGSSVLRFFLKQLSKLYELIVTLRLYFYRIGILRYHTLGCQVISIGNLTVGGTGKTPIVEIFARELTKEGRRVAVLSRGYKRKKAPFFQRLKERLSMDYNPKAPLVVSDGDTVFLNSAIGGDEPYMLATNLPGVCVLVDKDRVKSGQYAIDKLKCDTLILDDGFQYLRLKHTHEIVLVDSTNPFSNEQVLPRGLLREPVRNIARSDFIFLTKATGLNPNGLKDRIKTLNAVAEISECRHAPKYLQDCQTDETKPLEFLHGKRIAAVSGIASPAGFESALRGLGAHLVYIKRYTDHHRFTGKEIDQIIDVATLKGVELIITTEKDAVRLPLPENMNIPVYYLRVEIELLSGSEDFRACISRICFRDHEN
ncbi:MAG: tetraacyldisaccharide 4'-kinase [Lentisphaerae bacterium]|nr:tetraacyldisaccharide 4'-kinase [Lentisphaerota bacterium]